MAAVFDITDCSSASIDPLMSLYSRAFPDEDLRPLVRDLLGLGGDVISLCAAVQGDVVGHIIFTPALNKPASLLGPLAVHPDHQRKGVGSALIKAGFDRVKAAGLTKICVLGDPGYYGRFGFAQETQLQAPCPIPDAWAAAWQSVALGPQGQTLEGQIELPAPWMNGALWSDG